MVCELLFFFCFSSLCLAFLLLLLFISLFLRLFVYLPSNGWLHADHFTYVCLLPLVVKGTHKLITLKCPTTEYNTKRVCVCCESSACFAHCFFLLLFESLFFICMSSSAVLVGSSYWRYIVKLVLKIHYVAMARASSMILSSSYSLSPSFNRLWFVASLFVLNCVSMFERVFRSIKIIEYMLHGHSEANQSFLNDMKSFFAETENTL